MRFAARAASCKRGLNKPGSQYVAQLHGAARRGAARRGAVLATICEHSTAHESRREDRPEF